MDDSILDSIKKILGMPPVYDAFDTDLVIHINSVFGILAQLGVGPEGGFSISTTQLYGNLTWAIRKI